MTGPEHYLEAERLIREVACTSDDGTVYYGASGGELVAILPQLLAGLAHATLALAAASALNLANEGSCRDDVARCGACYCGKFRKPMDVDAELERGWNDVADRMDRWAAAGYVGAWTDPQHDDGRPA